MKPNSGGVQRNHTGTFRNCNLCCRLRFPMSQLEHPGCPSPWKVAFAPASSVLHLQICRVQRAFLPLVALKIPRDREAISQARVSCKKVVEHCMRCYSRRQICFALFRQADVHLLPLALPLGTQVYLPLHYGLGYAWKGMQSTTSEHIGDAVPPSPERAPVFTISTPPVTTPDQARKRCADDSGQIFGTSGRTSRSGRRRRRKRGRPPASPAGDLEGLPRLQETLRQKLTDAEARQQHEEAREERNSRRARELADHDRERETRRRHSTGQPAPGRASGEHAPGARRTSAPAGRRNLPRRKVCGKESCGWRPQASGIACDVCPGRVVHDEDTPLCCACHRTLEGHEVTHLGASRLGRAVQFVKDVQRRGQSLPEVVIDRFHPSDGCLCRRPDCFEAFFRSGAGKKSGRKCAGCSRTGASITWYKGGVAPSTGGPGGDSSGGGPSEETWTCKACYRAAQKDAMRSVGLAYQQKTTTRLLQTSPLWRECVRECGKRSTTAPSCTGRMPPSGFVKSEAGAARRRCR